MSAKVVAFANMKGGTGKTSSVLETAYNLSSAGKRVLVVDLDVQANATKQLMHLPVRENFRGTTVGDLMASSEGDSPHSLREAIYECESPWKGLYLLPSNQRMSLIESMLVQSPMSKEMLLKEVLSPAIRVFDFILIDCPPAAGLFVVNALVCATHYVIPIDPGHMPMEGYIFCRDLAKEIKKKGLNKQLKSLDIIITKEQKIHSKLSKRFAQELEEVGGKILGTIPHSTKLPESQMEFSAISHTFPGNKAAMAYKKISEVIANA